MMVLSRQQAAAFALLVCTAAGVAGYMTASPAAADKAGAFPGSVASASARHRQERDRHDAPAGTRDPEERHRFLTGRLDLRRDVLQAWALVRDLPQAEVEAELRRFREETSAPGSIMSPQGVRILLYRLAMLDPRQALEETRSWPHAREWRDLSPFVLGAWFRTDPQAVLDYSRSESGHETASQVTLMMGSMLAQEGTASGLEKAKALGPDFLRAAINALAIEIPASHTPQERQDFIDRITAQGAKETDCLIANSILVDAWGRAHPAEALEAGTADPVLANMRGSLFQNWFRQDPAAASNWSAGHPALLGDADRQAAYREMLLKDPAQAAQCLPGLQAAQPDLLEQTVKSLQGEYNLGGWSYHGPSPGALAQTANALRGQYQQWEASDANAATAWKNSLPADLRRNLIAPEHASP